MNTEFKPGDRVEWLSEVYWSEGRTFGTVASVRLDDRIVVDWDDDIRSHEDQEELSHA